MLATCAASSGALRFELDGDDARFLHLKCGKPLVVAAVDAFLVRQAERIPDNAHEAEHGAPDAGNAQQRIEFWIVAELELVYDFAGKVAREDELDLAGHCLLVDRRTALEGLFRIRAQEDALAHLDEDAGLGFVSGGDEADRYKSDARSQQGEAENEGFPAPQRIAQHAEVDVAARHRGRLPIGL